MPRTIKKNKTSDFRFVKKVAGIEEYEYVPNGLAVLYAEDRSAPVVAVNVTYRVGSRHEVSGHTGATHILEHMMFKGSQNFNKGNNKTIWSLLEKRGAKLNATTWFDRTNYYELIPKEFLADALGIEADRMRTLLFDPKELEKEMVVVRNEFERGENDPAEALDKAVWSAAFLAHGYHHSTIGWRSDIENITIDKLKAFYSTYYWPNNATLVVAGDVSKEELFPLITDTFGRHPRSSTPIPTNSTLEPLQEGTRRVLVERTGELPIVSLAHKAVEARHKDVIALVVLLHLLTGGRTSRLYRALVDSGLAVSVSGMDYALSLHDTGLFQICTTLTGKASPEEVEKIILGEYENAKRSVSAGDLNKVKAIAKAGMILSRDGVLSLVQNLNEAIAAGDWTLYPSALTALEKVTTADVMRVAKTYLTSSAMTVGYFIPKKQDKATGKDANKKRAKK